MQRTLVYALGALWFALAPVGVSAKAHVPIDRVQICTSKGKVKNVSQGRLSKEVAKGGCRLPACDFGNVFLPGDVCDNADDGDGFCDVPGSPPAIPAISAVGTTSACTNPY